MSNETNPTENRTMNRIHALADSLASIAHSPMGYLIGMALLSAAYGFGSRWDGHLSDRHGCVDLKEMQGQLYKVDTCSGKIELLTDDEKKKGEKPAAH